MRYSSTPGEDRKRFVLITAGICAGLYFAWCVYGVTFAARTTYTWPSEMSREDRKTLRTALQERREYRAMEDSLEFFKPWQSLHYESKMVIEPQGTRWKLKYENRSIHGFILDTYTAWKHGEKWQFSHSEAVLSRY